MTSRQLKDKYQRLHRNYRNFMRSIWNGYVPNYDGTDATNREKYTAAMNHLDEAKTLLDSMYQPKIGQVVQQEWREES